MRLFICAGTLLRRQFFPIQSLFCQCAMSSSNATVFVKLLDHDETMKITFSYQHLDLPSKSFTFQRAKSELLGSALSRMRTKIQASVLEKTTKKRKKKVESDADVGLPTIDIFIQRNGVRVPDDVENNVAWTSDSNMVINEQAYGITVNPPTVNSISLPKCILSRFPVYPKVSLDHCSLHDCTFYWYINVSKNSPRTLKSTKDPMIAGNTKWHYIAEGFVYDVQKEDEGCKFLVNCTPRCGDRAGRDESVVSLNCVTSGPEYCPFEDRHKFTTEITGSDSFRCLSYNILADLYADSDTARNHLFPYCPDDFLAIDYRKALYLKEIAGYNADIICLQEVDRTIFHNDLVPFLSTRGLFGVFNTKGGQVAEGLSCFYRESKFKLIESHSVILAEAIKNEPFLQHLRSKIEQNEKLAERFFNRTTALQVTLLESLEDPRRRVLVGNTHLYFHPESDNIRLLQGACSLHYLEHQLLKYQQEKSSSASLIFCGDFNSCPENGLYKFATEGYLPSDYIDWKSNTEEEVDGLELRHNLRLDSACGTPQYTNFTAGFVGCLDYIFHDKANLEVTSVVPLPSHEQVVEHVALPNKVFPSDHLAQVCTLKWK